MSRGAAKPEAAFWQRGNKARAQASIQSDDSEETRRRAPEDGPREVPSAPKVEANKQMHTHEKKLTKRNRETKKTKEGYFDEHNTDV